MTQRAAYEGEEEWIAKYRASLREAPLERSRFEGLREVAKKIWAGILIRGGKIFERVLEPEKHSQKPTIGVKKIDKNLAPVQTKETKAS